jgi:hypothetical protein
LDRSRRFISLPLLIISTLSLSLVIWFEYSLYLFFMFACRHFSRVEFDKCSWFQSTEWRRNRSVPLSTGSLFLSCKSYRRPLYTLFRYLLSSVFFCLCLPSNYWTHLIFVRVFCFGLNGKRSYNVEWIFNNDTNPQIVRYPSKWPLCRLL